MKKMKLISAIALIACSMLPLKSIAQTLDPVVEPVAVEAVIVDTVESNVQQTTTIEPEVEPVSESVVSEATIDTEENPQGSSVSIQDTAIDQTATDSSVLLGTTDPQKVEDSTQNATSTLPVGTTTDLVAEEADPIQEPVDSGNNNGTTTTTIIAPDPIESIELVNNESLGDPADPVEAPKVGEPFLVVTKTDLVPKEKYVFSLNKKAIASKEHPAWMQTEEEIKGKVPVKKVTDTPALSEGSSSGTETRLDISGKCSDPYFVVLLYSGEQDYDLNPNSYIYNKAFDCKNGNYHYSISDLPKTLVDKTYYLLIAGQGESGPWKPISAIIPVAITKEVTYQ